MRRNSSPSCQLSLNGCLTLWGRPLWYTLTRKSLSTFWTKSWEPWCIVAGSLSYWGMTSLWSTRNFLKRGLQTPYQGRIRWRKENQCWSHSLVCNEWMAAYEVDPQLLGLLKQCFEDKLGPKYTKREGLLLCKGWLYIPWHEEFKNKLLELSRNNPWGGHSAGLKGDLKTFIKNCNTCQRVKVDNTLPNGLL